MSRTTVTASHQVDRADRRNATKGLFHTIDALVDTDDLYAAAFAVKTYGAAMLAFYIAASIGLPRPFWAVTTCYVVSQPLAGATRSKAMFRLLGTVVGASAAVVLVGSFVNMPIVLSMAMATWLGFCIYCALLDATPRSYSFLLAGFTACIIAFQAVDAPGQVFETGILRVQEIGIGIVVSAIVHSLILPRPVAAQLRQRLQTALRDAERWSALSLGGPGQTGLDDDRHLLAVQIHELHHLAIHLPFDVASIVPRVRVLRALQDQISLMPLASWLVRL